MVRRKLYGYIEAHLTGKETEAVERHLASCPACRREEARIQTLIMAAESSKVPVPSEDFWKGFQTGLDDALNRRLVPGRNAAPAMARLRPAFALAAVCLVMAVALALTRHTALKTARLSTADLEMIKELSAPDGCTADTLSYEDLEEVIPAPSV